MRLLALFALAMMSAGCTTQAVGARCEQDVDCDTSSAACRSELNPAMPCTGSACICCPTDHATALTIPACAHGTGGSTTTGTDAGTPPG